MKGQVNRNKKSLTLSFAHPQGREILKKLAAKADVFVENYLPGTMARYGLDYRSLSGREKGEEGIKKEDGDGKNGKVTGGGNKGLIYASITGYGQTGPYSSRAGYDVMVEA